ncbi:MAG: ArsA family ATPase, partial [Actinobacteria bacterium]|nr:ArsA family ATPase [Actinomycetota bacterium]
FPVERKIAKAVRPVLRHVKSLPPIASDSVFEAATRFYERIDGIKAILTDPDVTSIRLVMNPEKMVIAEAQRTFAYLSLFGYGVDAIVVNRLLPDEVVDPYFDKWRLSQAEHMATIASGFSPLPILTARLFDQEMVGDVLLEKLGGEVYGELDPLGVLYRGEVIKVVEDEGGHRLKVRLPFTDRSEVDLSRSGDELFIKVGNLKKNLVLPKVLQRSRVAGARFEDDWLNIMFSSETPADEEPDHGTN